MFIPAETREIHGGWQQVYKFPNGYGASLVNHGFSYGLELAILKGGSLCYDSGIANDVIGNLEEGEVHGILKRISELPSCL